MEYTGIGIIFLLCLFLQGSVTNIPVLLLFLLFLYIFYRQDWVFLVAFFAGISLDVMTVNTIGGSSMFLITFLASVFIYQRKFEIGSQLFVFLSLFFGTLLYTWVFGYPNGFFMALVLGFVGVGCFGLLQKLAS